MWPSNCKQASYSLAKEGLAHDNWYQGSVTKRVDRVVTHGDVACHWLIRVVKEADIQKT